MEFQPAIDFFKKMVEAFGINDHRTIVVRVALIQAFGEPMYLLLRSVEGDIQKAATEGPPKREFKEWSPGTEAFLPGKMRPLNPAAAQQIATPLVAAADTGEFIQKNEASLVVGENPITSNLRQVLGMRPSAIARKYTRQDLVSAARQLGVSFQANATEKEIAFALLEKIKTEPND